MASIINAATSGAGGVITTADASGVLNIQTAGTTGITVSSSQVVSFTNNLGTVAGYPSYQCRAWVNFNGTGTVAIRASGNVSSITDNGVGDYTVNFATAMPDANYSVNGTIMRNVTGTADPLISVVFNNTTYGNAYQVGSVRVLSLFTSAATNDPLAFNVAIFR